jgi:hypothetical protein
VNITQRKVFDRDGFDRIPVGPNRFERRLMKKLTITSAVAEPEPKANEWPVGLVVGHWRVVGSSRLGLSRQRMIECVSRCGVRESVYLKKLKEGRPATCSACRTGSLPPHHQVGDSQPAELWEKVMAVELINPTSFTSSALKAWESYGLPAVNRMIGRTRWGAAFGWKLYLKEHHIHRKSGRTESECQLRDSNSGDRRVLLRVKPVASEYWFDVYLSWVRTDVGQPAVVGALAQACGDVATATADQPAEPSPPSAVSPAVPSVTVERLEKMKGGIERLIELNRDVSALAELKADAQKRYEKASAEVLPIREERDALAARRSELSEEVSALSAQAEDYRQKLAQTEAECKRMADQLAVVEGDLRVAEGRYAPYRDAFVEAEAGLREVEASERERLTAVKKAGDISLLLAALEKLG